MEVVKSPDKRTINDVKADTSFESIVTSCDSCACCENENCKDISSSSSDSSSSSNKSEQLLAYPKRVFLIIGNEFCERFNYYGMRTILAVYISSKLHASDREATVQYHAFNALVYFTCIFGSIISDTWLGKFKTILYLSIVYAIGSIIVAVGTIPAFDSHQKATLYTGLALIALGSGGIKPCVAAFGGDQFKLPEQAVEMSKFFSKFYFAINAGSLLSTAITPNLRSKVNCFGEEDCYALAFGVPAILMIVSIIFFVSGKSSYTMSNMSSENMLIRVPKCIWYAIKAKFQDRKCHLHDHFLDFSVHKYGEKLIDDTKVLLNLLVLFLPLPLFWALYDQQGSRWTFQAQKMNGDLGFYVIPFEQMQFLNPLLILVFIPVFDYGIYPLLSKVGVRRPLQKIIIGGFLAAFAFVLTAIVEWQIEKNPINSISIFYQLPQYLAITMGEIMFSITGLSFSYDQAPENMKSVVQALWILTIAFGNIIIILIEGVSVFNSRVFDILFFASIMALDMILFMYVAHRYKPKPTDKIYI